MSGGSSPLAPPAPQVTSWIRHRCEVGVYREEADTPEKVLLLCPWLADVGLRLLDSLCLRPDQLQDLAVSLA